MAISSSVDIYELKYTKAEIAAAPTDESAFFLLATGLLNDLQILTRQYTIAIKQNSGSKIKNDGYSAIAMLNLRLLTGRFYEGWKLIDDQWSKIELRYESRLSEEGKQAVLEIKQYFDHKKSDKMILMLRNKIAFHADFKFVAKQLNELADDTPMVDYIGYQLGDTLYFGCEAVHMRALQSITGKTTEIDAFGAVMDSVRTLQKLFLKFISAFVKAFANRHLTRAFVQIKSKRRIINDLPDIETLSIPFFINFSGIGD